MNAQGEHFEVVAAVIGSAGGSEIVRHRRGHINTPALEVYYRSAQHANTVAVDSRVRIAQMRLPQDGARRDAGRPVCILRGDGVERAAARGREDDTERLILK